MRTLHVGLRVRDREASLAFYRALGYEVLGEVPETSHGHLTMLKLPGDPFVTIELVDGGPFTAGENLNHLVVQVESMEAVTVETEPGMDTEDGMRTAWVTDPDGNRIEMVQWPPGHPEGMTGADFR